MLEVSLTCDLCNAESAEQKPEGWFTLTCRLISGGGRKFIQVRHVCENCASNLNLKTLEEVAQ